MLAYAEQ
jgi:hypothetical protein